MNEMWIVRRRKEQKKKDEISRVNKWGDTEDKSDK